MGITAISGPHIGYGITTTSTGGVTEYNEERGPSLYDLGYGMLDPRPIYNYTPGDPVGTPAIGFYHGRMFVDYIPNASSAATLVTSLDTPTVAVGTALTFTTSKSTWGAIPTTIVAPETGQTTGSLLAIDSTAAYLTFGSAGTVCVWNPAAGTGRVIRVALNSSGIATVSVAGRDMYGYKMTETITASSSDANWIYFTGRKAFKYLSAITPATTGTGAASTGANATFLDIFGMPLATTYVGMDTRIRLIATSSLLTADCSGSVTLASTITATATTSDVRGTYASTTTMTGSIRLQIMQNITSPMVASVTSTNWTNTRDIFGVTQYSSI